MVAPVIAAAALMAASQMGSSYMSAQSSWKKQKKMFAWQKAWEKEKMQNSYQWAVDDMQKAGLNPALGYSQGGATGSGAPNPSSPTAPNYDPSGAISSAMNTYNTTRQTDAQILETTARTGNIDSQTALNIANLDLVKKYGSQKEKSIIANNLADVGVKASQSAKNIENVNEIKGGATAKTLGTAATKMIEDSYKKLQKQQKDMNSKGWKSHLGGLVYTR